MVDRDTKQLLVRCRDLLEALTNDHSILTEIDLAINEPDQSTVRPTVAEVRHPTEIRVAHVWVDEAIRLANDYAHRYSFVNDDSMPRAQAALYAHLNTVVVEVLK